MALADIQQSSYLGETWKMPHIAFNPGSVLLYEGLIDGFDAAACGGGSDSSSGGGGGSSSGGVVLYLYHQGYVGGIGSSNRFMTTRASSNKSVVLESVFTYTNTHTYIYT